jgi:hypothetical protein
MPGAACRDVPWFREMVTYGCRSMQHMDTSATQDKTLKCPSPHSEGPVQAAVLSMLLLLLLLEGPCTLWSLMHTPLPDIAQLTPSEYQCGLPPPKHEMSTKVLLRGSIQVQSQQQQKQHKQQMQYCEQCEQHAPHVEENCLLACLGRVRLGHSYTAA